MLNNEFFMDCFDPFLGSKKG
jgi:hypothetical protein